MQRECPNWCLSDYRGQWVPAVNIICRIRFLNRTRFWLMHRKGYWDTITAAYTQPVKQENVSDTLRQQVSLLARRGVKFVPASIEMILPVDIYTEKTVEVPLHGVNFPADKVLRAFPSKVQVTFQVGLSRFREITADDFHINVSYEELLCLGSDKYTVKLRNIPDGVKQVRFNPEQVDFLIEQISPSL